jgi:hypothetical protein
MSAYLMEVFMESRNKKVTFEMPFSDYQKLKAFAVLEECSMKEILIKSFKQSYLEKPKKAVKKNTIKAMQEIEGEAELKSYDTVEEMFQDIGITWD